MTTKIRRLEVRVLGHDVAEAIGPAPVNYDSRSCVLVRLEDEDGRIGWGETYHGPGIAETVVALTEHVVGRDGRDLRATIDTIQGFGIDGTAVSALAMALEDLCGRQLEVPVYDLYGGRRRSDVRAYASSGGYRDGVDPEVSFADDVISAVTDGFTAVKIRIGRFDPRRELAILRTVRDETDETVDLMIDANGAYSLPRAKAVGRLLAELGYTWFEEPLIRFQSGMHYPGYEGLGGLGIAIAAAEGLQTRSAFDSFLARRGADIIQPDVGICGGVGEGLFIGELAALRGVPTVPHAWGGAVLMAATLQLLAVLPEPSEVSGIDSPLLEYDRFENRMRTELSPDPFDAIDGRVQVPTGPGIGVDIDEAAVDRLTLRTFRA